MRWPIGRRLAAGFALPLVVLAVLGVLSHRSLTRSIQTSRLVTHTHEVLGVLEQTLSGISAAESAQRGYLINGQEPLARRFEAEHGKLGGLLTRLGQLTADNPRQQARIEVLRQAVEEKVERMTRRLEMRRSQPLAAVEAALPTEEGKRLTDVIEGRAAEIEAEERQLLHSREALNEASIDAALAMILWGSVIGFVIAAVAAVMITRALTGPIQSGIQRLASSASEILAATTQQASGTQEQATAVQETTATVHEVKQTAQLSSQKAQAVADLVRKTAQTSHDGRRAAEESVQGMLEAKERMERIAQRVLGLSEQAQAIGEIIAVVNDLAEQSNLLAVNAAIEAAKAGEAGRGFAVVAGEVKGLAEQSKQATGQVRQILGEIQRATHAAVLATEQGVKAAEAGDGLARRTGEAILALTESLTDAAQAAQQIFVTAQEQSVGVDQVGLAMDNIRQVSTQNMAATRQMERAARDMNALAQQFKAMVTGSDHGRPNGEARVRPAADELG
jgi:methyl-accepting chemotaxis protein